MDIIMLQEGWEIHQTANGPIGTVNIFLMKQKQRSLKFIWESQHRCWARNNLKKQGRS